jgi:hypothetical protein
MADHPWHLFDAERGLEVRRYGEWWELRRVDTQAPIVRLDGAEFEQLREPGPDPEIMARLDDGAV